MKIGDCVQLKTGGCVMTINWVGVATIGCVWFDESQILHRGVFGTEALREIIIGRAL
jgi:uncharacterized protein YodC (DUF2158 family)